MRIVKHVCRRAFILRPRPLPWWSFSSSKSLAVGYYINRRITLLFLCTRVAPGGKKVTVYKKTSNLFLFNCQSERIDHGDFKGSNFEDHWQPEIAVWLPKSELLVSLKRWESVEITTANPGLTTIAASDCNSDRQPEIAIRPPKPEILISVVEVELRETALKFQWEIRHFRLEHDELDHSVVKWLRHTMDNWKWQDWRSKRLYYHFRLSIVVVIARGQFLRARLCRKFQVRRWNFDNTCHTFGDVSSSLLLPL